MLTTILLQSHQNLIKAYLEQRPAAWSKLREAGYALRQAGLDSGLMIAKDLLAMIPDGLICPLGNELLKVSPPRTATDQPHVAKIAVAVVIALGVLGKPVTVPAFLELLPAMGLTAMEDRFEALVKAASVLQIMRQPALYPVPGFYEAGESFRVRPSSPYKTELLGSLQDLDPWWDPTPKKLPRHPYYHPLQQLCERGLPVLLYDIYVCAPKPMRAAAMGVLLARVQDVWEHVRSDEMPALAPSRAAYTVLYAVTRRELSGHRVNMLGSTVLEDLTCALGGDVEALDCAIAQLGSPFSDRFARV